MKTINVTDEDYKVLMELSKELQIQEHDFQASPRFWSPRSTKFVAGTKEDDEVFVLDGYPFTADELFDDTSLRKEFLLDKNFNKIEVWEWEEFLVSKGYTKYYRREEKIIENNFSLFKSDVKNFIQFNKHHLGENPHTYANTIFRMNKMEKLIKCLCRINSYSKEAKYKLP